MKRPSVFGKYLLLERINVGGMAEVFIAKAFGVEGFERILAIKKILPTMAEDEEFITMFIDEARISVQLNHANIVHIHELGKHDATYFIAMEYVAGRDLRTLLERYRRRKEVTPTAQAVYVASKICEGLDYAHRKKDARGQELNIIHRDVSPQNILVSYEGEVKIIDFGIAKAANRSQKTQAGILKGKFGYMSPEQVRGLPIDRRSDVFAVGVILYEMLTGEKLFVGESDFSTLEKVRNAEVPQMRQFNPGIPPELEKVVLKALAREQEDRYQWASDLQEDLMRFLLAGDAIYSAKQLASFMREAFAEDLLREAEKMERFASIERPDQIEPTGVTAAVDRSKPRSPPSVGPPSRPSGRASLSAPQTGYAEAGVATGSEAGALDGTVVGERTQIVDPSTVGNVPSNEVASNGGSGNGAVKNDTGGSMNPLDDTLPPQSGRRGGNKPQVVIGDAKGYTGATVIGPLPEPVSKDEVDASQPGQSTLLFPKRTNEEDAHEDDVGEATDVSRRALSEEADGGEGQDLEPSQSVSVTSLTGPRKFWVPLFDSWRTKKWLLAAMGGVALVAVAGFVALFSGGRTGGVAVSVSPETARITIGGQQVRNNFEAQLAEGEYDVLAVAMGYKPSRKKITVVRGKKTALVMELTPDAPLPPPPEVDLSPEESGAEVEKIEPPRVFTAKFVTDVAGVEVLVDGKSVGKTPHAKLGDLPLGRVFQVVGKKPGFQAFEGEFSGDRGGEIEVPLAMVRAPPRDPPPKAPSKTKGNLVCGTRPAGAEVWVDGKNTGRQTPIPVSNPLVLPVGKRKVVFKLDGKQSGPHEVDIKEDEPTKLLGIAIE
ncbi:MAG: protein kinase domain-containing protein [Myxococcota bacterium]